MFERDEKTVYDVTAPPNTPIHAVQFNVNPKLRTWSRLNLVVRPECTGLPLRTKLIPLCFESRSVISDWKVMSPTLATEGPESAVIYLGAPLQDEKVRHLITTLSTGLRDDLVSLQSCPWGHVELRSGIYGFDLLDREVERNVLGQVSGGSAGNLMSAILCKAAWEAYDWLYRQADSVQRRAQLNNNAQREDFVRSKLDEVLSELGWELED